VDKDGNDNLAPYSFFNAFSSNPPVLVFSSNRRVATNTTKDTLHNIQETGECVINAVSYDIVRQMAITSVEFDAQESEFVKSGLTPIPSDFVKPKRVKESPVNMECKVREVVTLGQYGGAGHLIICEVLCMHIDDRVIVDGRIDPHKIDLMGRMGRAYYVRASGDAIHTIIQPVTKMVIGYNALPEVAKKSNQLTANDIGLLSGNFKLPTEEDIENLRSELSAAGQNMSEKHLTDLAQSFLAKDERFKALTCLFLI
jgi:flavin reductase (DIM6/NTAB) family NADH-FMN oxidoreductase RutF